MSQHIVKLEVKLYLYCETHKDKLLKQIPTGFHFCSDAEETDPKCMISIEQGVFER